MLKKIKKFFLLTVLLCINLAFASSNNNVVIQFSHFSLRANEFNKLSKTNNLLLTTFPLLHEVCYVDNISDVTDKNNFKKYTPNYILRYFALSNFIIENNKSISDKCTKSAEIALNNLCKANKITVNNLEDKGKMDCINKNDMLKPIAFKDISNLVISDSLPEYLQLSKDNTDKILLAHNKADDIKIGYFEYKVKKNSANAYQYILNLRSEKITDHADIEKKTRFMECKKHEFFYTSVFKNFNKTLHLLFYGMQINDVSNIFEDDEYFRFFKLNHYEIIGADTEFTKEIEYIFSKDATRIYRERFYEDFFRNKYVRVNQEFLKRFGNYIF